jgi:hypothetical protein
MRNLLLSSLLLLTGCTSVYMNLQTTTGNVKDVQKFRPKFSVALYRTQVDVIGNHLSGVLLIKEMPDSSTRMVFSNEIGLKFFDFEFLPRVGFKVHSIIKQMNKKPVIKTLRKDFELVLMRSLNFSTAYLRGDESSLYYIFPQQKGFYTYVTDIKGAKLVRMERSSKRKPVVQVIAKDYINGIPDTIGISHRNFNFTIGLKRIER